MWHVAEIVMQWLAHMGTREIVRNEELRRIFWKPKSLVSFHRHLTTIGMS